MTEGVFFDVKNTKSPAGFKPQVAFGIESGYGNAMEIIGKVAAQCRFGEGGRFPIVSSERWVGRF